MHKTEARRRSECWVHTLVLATALLALHPTSSQGAPQLPTKPILRIEVGAHTALVNAMSVDREARLLVSGSHDKTVRVWDLETGRALRVLRIPLSQGDIGKVYAVALSPDGALVAVGGWTGDATWGGHPIYLIDRKTGRFAHRIPEIPERVYHLLFSPDGRYLAATTTKGVRVYETTSYAEVGRDTYKGRSYWADFDQQGRLVTSSLDGWIRLYASDSYSRPVLKREAPVGRQPNPVAFSPDGKLIATGYQNTTRVDVLSSRDLGLAFSPDTNTVDNGNLGRIAWSRDGRYLYAAGKYLVDGFNPVRRWDAGGRGDFVEFKIATKPIYALIPLSDGRLALTWGSQVAVLDETGSAQWSRRGDLADFRGQRGDKGIRVSANGDVVEFGFEQNGTRRARFEVSNARLDFGISEDKSLSGPLTDVVEVSVTDWADSATPKINGKPFKLHPPELSRSLAIAADRKKFLLGADWRLRLFDMDGNKLHEVPVPGKFAAVNLTPDGRKAVAGFGDGTLRWYDISDSGELTELLAFFPQTDGRWVLWTPEGFFHASGRAEQLVGWHINRGPNRAPDFVPVEQLWELFKRPDVVTRRLAAGGDQTLRSARESSASIESVFEGGVAPRVAVATKPPLLLRRRDHKIELEIADNGRGFGPVSIRVNGVERARVPAARPADIQEPASSPGGRKANERVWRLSWPLTLKNGANRIEVVAYDGPGQITSEPLTFTIAVKDAVARGRSLYGLVVGISDYQDAKWQLKYADDDARAVAAELSRRAEGFFDQVHMEWLLVDQEATRDGIREAFRELAKRIQPDDVFILYLAGHSMVADANYYFVPQDAQWSFPRACLKNSLDYQTLRDLLADIQTETSLILLDTSDADSCLGRAAQDLEETTAINRLSRTTGRPTLSLSSQVQHVREGYGQEPEKHAVFTFALLTALANPGDHDRDGNGKLEISELASYISEEVPRLTRQLWNVEQRPRYSLHGSDFPIAHAVKAP